MVRVRRSRAEQLILVRNGGPPIVLAAETREPGQLAPQDVFQVSGDGAYLAYAFVDKLHVRAADGAERTIAGYRAGSEMRFSPDGRRLAAVVGDEQATGDEPARVVVMDVATGDVHEVARLPQRIRQLEWTRDRLVALAGNALVALPLDGPPSTLIVDDRLERIAAGGDGLVVFDRQDDGTHVLALDVAAPQSLHELHTVVDDEHPPRVLATPPPGHVLLGADRFAGGVVMWTWH